VGSERIIEVDLFAMLAFDMKDGTSGDRDLHHFFEAEGLRAELSFVVIPTSFLAPFKLNWVRNNRTIGSGVHLDQVGFSDKPQFIGNQPHTGDIAQFAPFSIARYIDSFMGEQAFRRELIILPNLLIQMQSRPPLAKEEVVDVANGD
jgi:hypothetical protein